MNNATLSTLLRSQPDAEPEGFCIAGCGTDLRSMPVTYRKPRTLLCGSIECHRTYFVLRRSLMRELAGIGMRAHLMRAAELMNLANARLEASRETA